MALCASGTSQPLAQRSTKLEIFETGIKVIDVLVPLERGGKAGLLGVAGVGKTVLLPEIIHNMIGHPHLISCRSFPPDHGRIFSRRTKT